MATTAAELIEWLESGGIIAITADGDPEHVMFLRFEIWESQGKIHKYLGAYGWGSVCGTIEAKLLNVLNEPYKWVRVEREENRKEQDRAIKAALKGIWHQEGEWKWRLVLQETRRPNVKISE